MISNIQMLVSDNILTARLQCISYCSSKVTILGAWRRFGAALLKNKAQTFAEKLLQEHNDMIYEFSNKASKMLIESLQQHINNKYASAQSNVIDNDTVRHY